MKGDGHGRHTLNPFTKDLVGLNRTDFVRFAGISGDFNRIHYEDSFATGAGLEQVIAQGPLTFVTALDALLEMVDDATLAGMSCRATAPVYPGEPLTVSFDGGEQLFVTKTDDATTCLSCELKWKK